MREYDPDFQPMSLDEAYLDITNYLASDAARDRNQTAEDVVRELRERICERTQLTASAGIAANGRLAKVGSSSLEKVSCACVVWLESSLWYRVLSLGMREENALL